MTGHKSGVLMFTTYLPVAHFHGEHLGNLRMAIHLIYHPLDFMYGIPYGTLLEALRYPNPVLRKDVGLIFFGLPVTPLLNLLKQNKPCKKDAWKY